MHLFKTGLKLLESQNLSTKPIFERFHYLDLKIIQTEKVDAKTTAEKLLHPLSRADTTNDHP